MTRIKCVGWYDHKSHVIARKYGGWVVDGDWNLYKTLADSRNAIDKRHDGECKAEPRIIRTLDKEEFVTAFAE